MVFIIIKHSVEENTLKRQHVFSQIIFKRISDTHQVQPCIPQN